MNWFRKALTEKCYEPKQRNKDGMRWIGHRFPIKDGISLRDVMIHNFGSNNQFIRQFAKDDFRIGETLKIRLPDSAA